MSGRAGQFRLGAFPVAIETAIFIVWPAMRAVRKRLSRIQESLSGVKLVLGIDRLDYSKGIPQRIRAFEAFLEKNPEWHGRVVLLQITPRTRAGIKRIRGHRGGGDGTDRSRQRTLRRRRLDADPLYQPILFAHGAFRHLQARRCRAGDAVARRHESRRQGISGGAGPRKIRVCWCCPSSPALRRISTAR